MTARRWTVLALSGLAAGLAAASPTPARLTFVREPGAEACPDEATLRAGVTARLGDGALRDDAPRTIDVRIGAAAGGFSARIEVVQPERHARRTLRSSGPDCTELGAAVVLALSLAIDPAWDPETPSNPNPDPSPNSNPPPPLDPARPVELGVIVTDEELPVERPARAGPWRLGAGSFATVGASPALVVGARLELGVRSEIGSLSIEPWLTLPAATSAPGGRVSMTTIGASLVACRTLRWIDLCAEASGGVFQAVGEGQAFIVAKRAVSPFAAAGARAQWIARLTQGLDLQLSLDVQVSLLHTRLMAEVPGGEIEAWSAPYVLPSLGLALVGHFG